MYTLKLVTKNTRVNQKCIVDPYLFRMEYMYILMYKTYIFEYTDI